MLHQPIIRVDPIMFNRMKRLEVSTFPPDDPSLAAWSATGLAPRSGLWGVTVIVDLPTDPAKPDGWYELSGND